MKNFGLIKTIFTNVMVDAIVEKNSAKKKLYVEFVNKVKKNKILKKQFEVYTLLEEATKIDGEIKHEFIKESISLLSDFDRDKIVMENLNLVLPISEMNYDLEIMDYPEKKLHESISELIFTKKSAKTLNQILEHTKVIGDYFDAPKQIVETKGPGVPNSMLAGILVNKFNDKYSSLSENELRLINTIVKESTEDKQQLQSDIVKECITLIDEKLADATIDIKETLLNVKSKLLSTTFLEETYVTETVKLIELIKDLKEE